jgi:nicotinate dehydrogenase subunit A
MVQSIKINVNNKEVTLPYSDPDMPLLYLLRNELGLKGPRFGCGLGQCGSCTVHVNGEAVRSCVFPVSAAKGKNITTLEGLGSSSKPDIVQQAFIDEQAAQCGYCINGMVMQAKALLNKNKKPSETEIKEALANNLCRCGTHQRIVRAVQRASAQLV